MIELMPGEVEHAGDNANLTFYDDMEASTCTSCPLNIHGCPISLCGHVRGVLDNVIDESERFRKPMT